MKTAATLASLVLAAGTLTACGSDGDAGAAPEDASTKDFCTAFASQFTTLSQMDQDDAEAAVDAGHAWAKELREAGTPEDMPREARQGFEAFVDDLAALDRDATLKELEDVGNDAGEEVEAFVTYSLATCPDAMSGMLGELGDQMEQELGDIDLGDLNGG